MNMKWTFSCNLQNGEKEFIGLMNSVIYVYFPNYLLQINSKSKQSVSVILISVVHDSKVQAKSIQQSKHRNLVFYSALEHVRLRIMCAI